MTVLSIVNDASTKCGFARRTQLVADTGATSLEIQATLADVAGWIRDWYDWSVLKTLGVITGDGVTLAFSLPTDYSRMVKQASLWPSGSPFSPLTHITESDDWLGFISQNYTVPVGAWTMLGGKINIRSGGATAAFASGATASYYYITRNVFADSGGTAKSAITADTDTFRLHERLLRLGFIAKWKSDKGRPYAQDQSDFMDALSVAVGGDKGSKTLIVGRRRTPIDADIALPWGVPFP